MKNFTFPFKNKIKKSNPKAGFLIIVLALGCQKVQRLSPSTNPAPYISGSHSGAVAAPTVPIITLSTFPAVYCILR